jgi:hypothetical protein
VRSDRYLCGAKSDAARVSPPAQAREPEPEQPEEAYPSNIMFDRRVVRGNTYASRVLPAEPALLSSGGGGGGGGGKGASPK